ncbi:exodeoxyribonuclease VII small subunit [Aquimonas voraii]|uniref:Exodeoxyribonuclease 7 small subunit n=1 Tax=Aquimonas voraii TaxID=265719 RepID=A0A1G6RTZ6_9GAMM|nr:exodeoxyribonuclease VII small subunit [Aquimonas voraii]SDD08102.1 Exodeoxyribonuclease VII small subunit [Aquimonas voraii]
MSTPDPAAPAPEASTDGSAVAGFERSLDELESLVQRLEKGDLSLDESLKAYERGIALFRSCQTALDQAELRVRLLSDPDDPDSAQPFATDAP